MTSVPEAERRTAERIDDPGDADHAARPIDDIMPEDGRTVRRQRNRLAVVDALLELYRDGDLRPGTTEIAERAGLSPRSLFRYFEDVDDLTLAAIDRAEQRALPLLLVGVAPDDRLEVRIGGLVDQRLRLFDAMAPVARVSRLNAPFQALLTTEMRRNRALLRRQIGDLFASELTVLGTAAGEATLAALDVLGSFESYELLRTDQGLSTAQARSVLVAAMSDLLTTPTPE